jgi:hypothetical protein
MRFLQITKHILSFAPSRRPAPGRHMATDYICWPPVSEVMA